MLPCILVYPKNRVVTALGHTVAYLNQIDIAFDEGFTIHHTGGGIAAFHKFHADDPAAYYMITPGEHSDLDQPVDDAIWQVGLYQVREGHDRWLFVAEDVTLREALEKTCTLPLPDTIGTGEPEKSFETWAEVEALVAKPVFR